MLERAGWVMGIKASAQRRPQRTMAIASMAGKCQRRWPSGIDSDRFSRLMSVDVKRSVAEDAHHELAVDGLEFAVCGQLERVGSDAVGVA